MRIQRNNVTIPRALARLAWTLLLYLPVAPLQSQVVFESKGPDREVSEGSRFEVSFTLKNAAGKRFIAPNFGFPVSSGPVEMRGSGFINGQTYSHQTWSYELEAGKPGTYTIGPATVQTSSQTLRSQPLTIRVVQARQGRAKPDSKEKVFLSGELDRSSAWVGQQVHYQLKLYTQLNLLDCDILELPKFDGFYARERQRFDTRTEYQTIRGQQYAVRILFEMALFPQESGEQSIGIARARVQTANFSTLLGSMPSILQTQPVKLQVKALPEPAPIGFLGGIGHYEWKVKQDKDVLTTDDAATLTVTIQGNGDARRFANPKFILPEGIEGLEPKVREDEEYETGDQFVHSKTLEYAVLPKHPGEFNFTPQLLVFDPDSNRYLTLQAEQPVQLHVTPGQQYGKNTTPSDTLAVQQPLQSPLLRFWEISTAWLQQPLIWGSAAGLAALTALFFLFKKQRNKKPAPAPPPSAGARQKDARERFKQAYYLIRSSDSRVFYHEILKSLQDYLAAGLYIEPAQVSKEEVRERLAGLQIPEPVIQSLLQVWQTCEVAVFAGQAQSSVMQDTWQKAETVVRQLDGYLKR